MLALALLSSLGCGASPAGPDAGATADAATAALDLGAPDAGRDTSTELCRADSQVGLPADDGVHTGEAVEWWYWTGHLQDTTGRWFGYQVTFFVFGFGGLLMNAALTDIDGAVFHRDAQFLFAAPDAIPNAFGFTFDRVVH